VPDGAGFPGDDELIVLVHNVEPRRDGELLLQGRFQGAWRHLID
jgi:hypothetical protein